MSNIDEKKYRISNQSSLKDYPTAIDKKSLGKKSQRKALAAELSERLDCMQELLYAEKKRGLLIVLQGMDTAGKDSTIRRICQNVDPLGVRVQAFGVPSEMEASHDYLWRVHAVVPARGEITIFNRSHYEDVLVTRVRGWISAKEQKRRIRQINAFERMLVENGIGIVKFFLNISKDEQRKRLQERIDNKEKNWKFRLGDLDDRALWEVFQKNYEDVLRSTSTKYARWYAIPADSKTVRDVIILRILLNYMKKMNMRYPEVDTSGWPKQVK